MGDQDSDPFVDEILRRRGQVNVFDLLKQRFKRSNNDLKHDKKRSQPSRPVLAVVSLLVGVLAAWPDVSGGAGASRIFLIWMVSAGVCYAVLTKLETVLFWAAVGTSVASIFILAAQTLDFIETGLFPVWHVGDMAMAIGFPDAEANSLLDGVYDLIALATFCGVSVLLWIIVWGSDRFTRSAILRNKSSEDSS